MAVFRIEKTRDYTVMSAKLQPSVHCLRLQTVFPETQDRAAGKVLQPLLAVSKGVGGG